MNNIKVLVLKRHPGGNHTWNILSKLSSKFGGYKISVSVLREDNFEYDDIRKASPDILILSDSAGTPTIISEKEMNAINMYVSENTGKGIIATYATFFYEEEYRQNILRYDNRKMLPLFGMKPNTKFMSFKNHPIKLTSCNKDGDLILNGIERTIRGYSSTQTAIGGWENCLVDGKIIAVDKQTNAVIIQRKTDYFTTLYISSMPEYDDFDVYCDAEIVYRLITHCYKSSHSSLQTLCCQSVDSPTKMRSLINSPCLKNMPPIPKQAFVSSCLHRFKFSQKRLKHFNSLGISPCLTNLAAFKTRKYVSIREHREP